MFLDYVPLLQTQLELQRLPLKPERFETYLRTMTPDRSTMVMPPLALMNPMGKGHITEHLEQFLALDADGVARRVLEDAASRLAESPGSYKVGLVVVDDLHGGWTNRFDYEFTLRFGAGFSRSGGERPKWLDDDWLTVPLWSSEPPTESAIREGVLASVFRADYVQRRGAARTLRDMLAQEGYVLRSAGCPTPTLDDEDIDFTREVLAEFLDAEDKRTCMECLFGDEPGRTLGFTPRGLSPWAGLALALHDSRREFASESSVQEVE